jgi:hypothetical protein
MQSHKNENKSKSEICNTCGEGNRVISIDLYPEDKFADLNKSKCGTCVIYDIENTILENAPNSNRANEIIAERQKRIEQKLRNDELKHSLKTSKSARHIFKDPGIRSAIY